MIHTRNKPAIWFISKQDALLRSFQETLYFPAKLKHLSDLKAVEVYLDGQAGEVIPPALILLDTATGPDLITTCQKLCQVKLTSKLPIIAIIAKLDERQPALTAGADDYLLLPLLSAELQRRLAGYLNPTSPDLTLEGSQLQAMRNAFVVLATRIISERRDLNTTLSLTLELIVPLLDASGGDIWLFDEDTSQLERVSSLNVAFSNRGHQLHPEEAGLIGWVANHNESLYVPVADQDFRFDPKVDRFNQITDYSFLAVPLRHHNTKIGVLAIHNEQAMSFTNQDMVLLEGIAALTASAINYARLMQEREHLHHEVIQNERLATMGRLTAVLSHEINNPMQAIQGALMLAKEMLDESLHQHEDLTEYIGLCLKEAERVVELVGRMRQIYRPRTETPKALQLNTLLQDVSRTAQKAMTQQKVTFRAELTETLPAIIGIANQLHLVFLSLLLNFSDRLAGGGEIHLRTLANAPMFEMIISATANPSSNRIRRSKSEQKMTEVNFGLFMSQEIISAHNGRMQLSQQPDQIICRIELPMASNSYTT